MAQSKKLTEKRVDQVLDYIAHSTPIIADAHETLGVDLEILLCAAIKKALDKYSNGHEQITI